MITSIWKGARKTSDYGMRNGVMHHGVDYATFQRDVIPAFYPGEVVFSGWGATGSGLGGYGNIVIIRDRWGNFHLYAHLVETMMTVGQKVGRGYAVGRMGNTGNSNGAHLHFEVRTPGPQWGWRKTMQPEVYLRLLNEIDEREKETKGNATVHEAFVEMEGEIGDAINIDGRVYVPTRWVTEKIPGASIEWVGSRKTAIVKLGK